jgi:2-C-methyl-D-erythritol 4-phosphate cytidylyltransferase / 2-C-methyl-D-erythritol 2,4-cyclodiphosphate synthase
MHVTAIIAAGGRGLRLGGTQPKQLIEIGGRPILERSVAAFLSHPGVDAVVVALPPELAAAPPEYLRRLEDAGARLKPLRIVAGGERRRDSVANAFDVADPASDVIVIHDAARPFASAELISRTIAAAAERGAALAAVQARDTIKRVVAGGADATSDPSRPTAVSGYGRTVAETLPRETIYLAQTPQAFRRDVLAAALARGDDATDEAALAELAGHRVLIVDGEATNIKITTAEDLPIAAAIAESLRDPAGASPAPDGGFRIAIDSSHARVPESDSAVRASAGRRQSSPLPARTGRAGMGYDLHRLVEGRPLVLAGVTVPSDRGALGHSDADVVCHAVTDALLGAACLGDIGRHFPDTDPRWKDASSIDLLRRAVALVGEQGLGVGNVDVTVILERPKIRDHIDRMRAALAGALAIDVSRVSIKGKTNEGVDAVGRGEAIAAHAVALVRAI